MVWSADNSTLETHWPYTKQIAGEMNTGWVDHTLYSVERFQALGKSASEAMFPLDHTHTNAAGAKCEYSPHLTFAGRLSWVADY